MRLGVSYVPGDPTEAADFAARAERSGLDLIGIADTPHLRGGAFPAVQHALATTSRVPIGTFVTNPVLRHPAVLAADYEALARLYPDRVVAGIGAGDSAVRSVGRAPARPLALAAAVRTIRARVGPSVRILVAASGVSTASAIPAETDGIIIGGGLDAKWLTTMIAAAEGSAGHRLERWAFAVGTGFGSVATGSEETARLVTSVVTISRHALRGSPRERGVPDVLADDLAALYERYDVRAYGDPDGSNARLLRAYPEVREFLLRRFALAGSPADVAGRLRALGVRCGLDGVVATTGAADPPALAEQLARELLPRIRDR